MNGNQSLFVFAFPLLVGAALLPGSYAIAGTVSVDQSQCSDEVTLVADDAMLSEVFTELATKLGFALRFDRESDRSISIDATRPPQKLIEALTREDNVMITTEDDPECAGQSRISEVRFLAAGNPIVLPAHVPANAPPMQPVATVISKPAGSLKVRGDKTERKRRRDMTPQERALDRERRRQERRQ